ncbi:MAG: hypothetical protein GX417_01855 [Clostridiales bacterium]|nr:hypothetical protein [Clostridiales bacterium]
MSKHPLYKIIFIIFVGAIIICIPLGVARLMDVNSFIWMETDNDWIGFWGGYLGGIVTLFGVFLTIMFTRKDEATRQKLSIRPYINIESLYNNNITEFHSTPLEVCVDELSDTNSNDYSIRINELIILCKIKNVGSGTAINCRMKRFYFENKCFDSTTKILPALQMDGTSYIRVEMSNINLQRKDLSLRFLNGNKNLKDDLSNKEDSKAFVKLELSFEDLLGNQLAQEYIIYIQILERIPVILSKEASLFIENISKPNEYSK